MKTFIITIFFTFSAFFSNSQSTSKYPTVGDFKGLYHFNRCCLYDIDLKRQSNNTNCEAIVSFNVEPSGTGTLAFFMIEKLKFRILQCYKVENEYQFNLQLDNGKVILGLLKVDARNNVESFWLFVKPDEAIIAFSN